MVSLALGYSYYGVVLRIEKSCIILMTYVGSVRINIATIVSPEETEP